MRGFAGNKFGNQQGGRGNYNPRGQPAGGGRGGGGGGRFPGNQPAQNNPRFQGNQNPPRHPNQSAKPMNNPFASNQGIAMQTQSTQGQGNPFQKSGTQQNQMQVSGGGRGGGGRGQGVAAVGNNPFARPQGGTAASNQPFVNQQPFAPAQGFQQAPPQNAFNPVNMGTSNTPMVSYNFMQPAPAPAPAINGGNPFAVAPVQQPHNIGFTPAPAAPAVPFTGNPFNPNAQQAPPGQGGFMGNTGRPPVSGRPFNNPFAAGGGAGGGFTGGGFNNAAPAALNVPTVTTEQAKAEIKNIDFKSLLQGSSNALTSDHPTSALKMNSVIMSDPNEDAPPIDHSSELVEEEKLVGENLVTSDEVEEGSGGNTGDGESGGEIDEKLLAWMDAFPFKQFLSNKEELINPFQLLDGGRLTYGRLPAAIP